MIIIIISYLVKRLVNTPIGAEWFWYEDSEGVHPEWDENTAKSGMPS
jgi:hypothetical protein